MIKPPFLYGGLVCCVMRKVLSLIFLLLSTTLVQAFSPSLLTGSMDETFYSQKGPVFRVVYDSFDVLKYTQIMKVKVPTNIRLNNLKIWVTTYNITRNELNLAKTKIPFTINASPFMLVLNGKNRKVVFKANSATLTPINTISLKGNITLITKTTTKLGDSAQLSLEGDMLIFSCGDQKIALKF